MLLIVFLPIISSNSCLKLARNWSMFEISMLPMVALIILVYLKQSISCLNGFVKRSLDDILQFVSLVRFVVFVSYDTRNGTVSPSIIWLLLISIVCLFIFAIKLLIFSLNLMYLADSTFCLFFLHF